MESFITNFTLLPIMVLFSILHFGPVYPFQSDMVKNICQHVSKEDYFKIAKRIFSSGAIYLIFLFGVFSSILTTITFDILMLLLNTESQLLETTLTIGIFWMALGALYMKFKSDIEILQKIHLASTQWATDQGITAHDIELYKK